MIGRLGFSSIAAVAAGVAAVSVPGHAFGINLVIVGTLMLVAILALTRSSLGPGDATYFLTAGLLISFAALRAAGWVIALDLIVALVSVSVGVARARGWTAIVLSAPRALRRMLRGVGFSIKPLWPSSWQVPFDFGSAVRTTMLSGALLIVFGSLFLSADAAFAAIAEDLLVPQWDLTLVPARVAVALVALGLTGGLALLSPLFYEPRESIALWSGPPLGINVEIGRTEWRWTLILIDLLFAAFVAVQFAVLFGGHDHVLRTTGLTYAQYAREGFFQLVAVAVLTIGVVAGTVRFARAEGSDRAWMKTLLGIMCVLTLVILASALKRMNLYEEAYGFTRLRLLVDVAIFFLGGVLLLPLVAGARWNGAWLPRATVALAVVIFAGFSIYNPDARIAERNVDRFDRTGDIDLFYVASLGPDAVPELVRLPEPERSCVLTYMGTQPESLSLWSWNLGRTRAQAALESIRLPTPQLSTCVDL